MFEDPARMTQRVHKASEQKIINAPGEYGSGPLAVYVVNLPDAAARRRRIEQHLTSLQVSNVCFVAGIKGAALDAPELGRVYDDKAVRKYLGRSLSFGEIGCTLSHLKVCNLLLECDDTYALVLEDDALLSDSAMKVAQNGKLQNWMAEDKPRIVLMSKASQFLCRRSVPLIDGYRVVKVRNAWYTHGYLINRAAAKKLTAHNRPIRCMVDHWIEIEAISGVSVHAIDPWCIGLHESAKQSQIEEIRHHSSLEFSKLQFARFLGRKIARRLANAFYYGPIYGFGTHDAR